MMTIGLCACGCGARTTIPTKSHARTGRIKGVPMRYVSGHNSRGATHSQWKGGRKRDRGVSAGDAAYIEVHQPHHPRARSRNYVKEHILVVERVLGGFLPVKARVHHVNEVRSDNAQGNLIICENEGYHRLLHQRAEAYRVTGNAGARRCARCQQWSLPDDPDLVIYFPRAYVSGNGRASHRSCNAQYERHRGLAVEAAVARALAKHPTREGRGDGTTPRTTRA